MAITNGLTNAVAESVVAAAGAGGMPRVEGIPLMPWLIVCGLAAVLVVVALIWEGKAGDGGGNGPEAPAGD